MKWILLFVVITLGVTAGNLASSYIQLRIAAHALNAEATRMSQQSAASLEKARREQEARRAATEERRRQQRQQANKDRSAQDQLRSTCHYWIAEYRRTGNELDMIHRDKSCREAGIRAQ
ncbi:hypothetical protein [Marinimicrobium sp. ABcell2]|uniref:hypothetical protein n=1 Tax=Marinimicrobium sp. ABcell2 TaxID=3069751 RepID=UPI0027B7EFC2|nr:hypothetical protein [Marinimicrobium sp. ABcell2]MDQ2077368.1 hypothetical protein [Marinimicrobium sp. ABcell2]